MNKVKELLQLTETEHCVTLAYHPQRNGLTEIYHQTIRIELLATDRTLREDNIMAEWDTEDIVQQAKKMAKLKHKIHQVYNWEAAQEMNKMYYDKKHADPIVCTNQLLSFVFVVILSQVLT